MKPNCNLCAFELGYCGQSENGCAKFNLTSKEDFKLQ